MFSITSTRAAFAAGATVVALALLAGCGDHDRGTDHDSSKAGHTPSAAASEDADADFNAQDVAFATNMIGHHRQAVMMASIAPDRDATPEVKALAAKIQAAQQPEIDAMSGWLKAWGKPVPSEAMDHGAGPHMPGMMTGAQMDELNAATGPAFDKLFLTMMIEHHEGAVTMSKAQESGGKNSQAKTLATKIIADQAAEIAAMQKMLEGR